MIKHKDNVKGLRAIDVAPTIAFLMDIPGPLNARGQILYDIVEDAEHLQGSDDPRHQRLPRPADTARPDGGQPGGAARSASAAAAFLKPWLDWYRDERGGEDPDAPRR